jgi:succinyl-CoA synthetase alpha subunit
MTKQIRLLRSVLALPGSRLKMTEAAPIYGADVYRSGPQGPGVIAPGEGMLDNLPMSIGSPARFDMVSRLGTLDYAALAG